MDADRRTAPAVLDRPAEVTFNCATCDGPVAVDVRVPVELAAAVLSYQPKALQAIAMLAQGTHDLAVHLDAIGDRS